MKFTLASSIALLVGLAACGQSSLVPGAKTCTTIGCENNAKIDFTFRERGSYVFDVTVDGVKATCMATLPLPRGISEPCDRTDVLLALSGSELPPEQQSIGGLILLTTTAKTVVVRATRDGALLAERSIDLSYTVTPGPNGPDCEPDECRSASATLL
jgi:hypothetical protein